jgi:GT2 family glycosyltransferase
VSSPSFDSGVAPPTASIVIVSWNGRHYLDNCLKAVAVQEGVDVETILVDNASTDDTLAFVRERFPWVRIVALDQNRGFAGGNNAGVREARGRYIALLNNDTIADPGWLRALLDGIDEQEGFLLTTARIVYMHDPALIDSAGDGVILAGGAFKREHGARGGAVESREVFGVCGAACLMPLHVFNELGGFDEDFFFSHEDVDLSYRARLRGYRCRFVATAIVRHHGGGTSGKTSPFAVFHGQRNLEWMYLKDTPAGLLLRTLPAHLVYNAAAAVHFARIGCFGAFLRAKLAALAGLPGVLRKRARVQSTRRVKTSALVGQMERRWLATKLREKRFDVGVID